MIEYVFVGGHMKIIGKDFCYIQMEDLIYLLRNESSSFPNEIYNYLRDRDVNPMNQYCYVKIVNPKWINYIKNKNAILDFDFLASKTIPELEELCDEFPFYCTKENRHDGKNVIFKQIIQNK